MLTESSLLSDHILYVRRMDKRTRGLLKGTILVSELSVAYCHIIFAAAHLLGVSCNDDELQNLQYGSALLATHLDS